MTLSGMGRLDGRSAGLGAVAGVLAAGAALGVGQFVAGLTGASGSPVVVVGELQIDFTPPWLKNFAITEFGADDKLVLVTGIVVVLGAFAALVGAAATRRMAYGMAGIAVFAAVGLTAAATRPHATDRQPAAHPGRDRLRGGRAPPADSPGAAAGPADRPRGLLRSRDRSRRPGDRPGPPAETGEAELAASDGIATAQLPRGRGGDRGHRGRGRAGGPAADRAEQRGHARRSRCASPSPRSPRRPCRPAWT